MLKFKLVASEAKKPKANFMNQKVNQSEKTIIREVLSLLLVWAVAEIYPKTKFGLSQVRPEGFLADFDCGPKKRLSSTDLTKIAAQINQLLKENDELSFTSQELSSSQASDWCQSQQQGHLKKIIDDLSAKKEVERFYLNRFFGFELISKTKLETTIASQKLKNFELNSLSGAYLLDQDDQVQLQRISGVAFSTSQELSSFLKDRASSQANDHRRLAKEQEIFMQSEIVGSGLPLLLKNGTIIRRCLEKFVIDNVVAADYEQVMTQDITQIELYEKSGHYPYYKDSMYDPITIDKRKFMLRPMNCPHHFQIYNRRRHSYREMPVKLAELGKLYRYEKSGELGGLLRTRCFTLSDCHIICRPDQGTEMVSSVLDLIEKLASVFGLLKEGDYSYRLSLNDPNKKDKYFDDPAAWETATDSLRQALANRGQTAIDAPDDAAFYGPKIDIQMKDINGREETAFTVQYDFVQPKRFNLTYDDQNNQPQEAIVIHHSVIGSFERIMAFLIERYQGCYPFWLNPVQLQVLVVDSEDQTSLKLAQEIKKKAWDSPGQVRAEIDKSSDSLGKKIKRARQAYAAVIIVLGKKEVSSGQFEPQLRSDLVGQQESPKSLSVDELIDQLSQNARQRGLQFDWTV